MEQEHRKSKKIIFLLMLFLLLILVGLYAVYAYYTKNIASQALQEEVLQSLHNNDLSFFLKQELYQSLFKRMKDNHFELDSDITLTTTMENNMFSKLDLSQFQLHHKWVKDQQNQKVFQQLQTQYAGNDVITLDMITNPQQMAMKSDEIVNKYVGVNRFNLQNTVNQIYQKDVDLSDWKIIKNFILKREMIDLSNLQSLGKNVALLEKEIVPENISKKENVVLTMEQEQVTTTEYTISFQPNQVNTILERNCQKSKKRRYHFFSICGK